MGRYLSERPSFTLDPLFHAGAYYVQDASAMMVGWLFRKVLETLGYAADAQEGAVPMLRVLDLCAAPGGKSTDIAASLREACGPSFVLVSNEVIKQRSAVLQDNMAIWGDPNVVVCSSDPADFGVLGGFFDVIVADVPCSGEGMFRKSENARNMWSEDNVSLCAARQKRIIADVWDALAPGGVLIYSTCTLNDRENDGNVAWAADSFGAEVLRFGMPFDGPELTEYGILMTPGKVRGEGQYCAALRKPSEARAVSSGTAVKRGGMPGKTVFEGGVTMFDRNGELYALTDAVASEMSYISRSGQGRKVRVLGAGVHAFTMKGRDRIPCADLALSTILQPDDFPTVELSRQDALRFLHKDSFPLPDAPTGYVVVTCACLPLGFMKNLGNRANNLHPAGRRILMNVQ